MYAFAGHKPTPSSTVQPSGGTLRFQRCCWCTDTVMRPRLLCPSCGGADLGWESSTGVGRVHSWLKTPRRGHTPSVAVVVELAEGFRLRAQIVGVRPGDVPVGARVRFDPFHVAGDHLPVFRVEPTPVSPPNR
ncbi:Zn-ribbon domain-containing OB-fold protein [Streptomyces sp. NPDC059866]|uniref:Zn-ribbon domain-containing OB-fold protein n=1 Tax=Streptomyces sp. NPDC059866 TaxID=3346978 RepID=UPI00365BD7EC